MTRSAILGGVLSLLLCAFTFAADDGENPAADVPELEPLGNFAGKWDVQSTIKNPEHPEAFPATGSSAAKWIHNGRYLRQTWSIDASQDLPAFNGSNIWTYDPRKKVYRGWSFDSNGTSEESEGTWDPKSRTLKMTVKKNAMGGTSVVTSTFPEDGKETWSIVMKNSEGKVVVDVSGTSTRRAK
jgi:hypothetical protein